MKINRGWKEMEPIKIVKERDAKSHREQAWHGHIHCVYVCVCVQQDNGVPLSQSFFLH